MALLGDSMRLRPVASAASPSTAPGTWAVCVGVPRAHQASPLTSSGTSSNPTRMPPRMPPESGPKPSKPWGCGSRRCRRRTWRSCVGRFGCVSGRAAPLAAQRARVCMSTCWPDRLASARKPGSWLALSGAKELSDRDHGRKVLYEAFSFARNGDFRLRGPGCSFSASLCPARNLSGHGSRGRLRRRRREPGRWRGPVRHRRRHEGNQFLDLSRR